MNDRGSPARQWISAKQRHPADCSRIMAHRKQKSCDAYNSIFTVGIGIYKRAVDLDSGDELELFQPESLLMLNSFEMHEHCDSFLFDEIDYWKPTEIETKAS